MSTPQNLQQVQAFASAWLTYIPLGFVLWYVANDAFAFTAAVVLTFASMALMNLAQLNFYRSRAAKDERKDDADHHKFFAVADNQRTVARWLQAAALAAPLGIVFAL